MAKFSRRTILRKIMPLPFALSVPAVLAHDPRPRDNKKNDQLSIGYSPVIRGRSIEDILMSGEAGLRKHFGAIGNGVKDDTHAFNDWWDCLINASIKRFGALDNEIDFMLQKGPKLFIENGVFIYSGPGLDFKKNSSLVLNVSGESSLSTKIIIDNDSYLFDLNRNPVYTNFSDMTIYGGKGAVRFKSTERTISGIHYFSNLRVSRYKECAISNNSIDMPYFRVDNCIFYGDFNFTPIGVCVSGYAAGGFISNSIFSDNIYNIKLSISCNEREKNGPATPYNIVQNDFYRTGNLQDKNSYDIWIEPGVSSNNAGRGIVFSRNKFGQENLIPGDSHIILADKNNITSSNYNGSIPHSTSESDGFISGLRFESNNVNSRNSGYSAPFIISYTPNVGNNHFSDIYDNGMPEYILMFSNVIRERNVTNLCRSNYFDAAQCLPLQKGDEPKLLSNYEGVFSIHDPLQYFSGHPQSDYNSRLASANSSFDMLYNSSMGELMGVKINNTSVDNSYGGVNEASIIHAIDKDSALYKIIKNKKLGKMHWIDFELKKMDPSFAAASVISIEIYDVDSRELLFRRKILLASNPKWQRVILNFMPSSLDKYEIKISANQESDKFFIIGNFNVYAADAPINTGHNGGVDITWNRQHITNGRIHEWYDAEGFKRAKIGYPSSDKDGVVISSNSLLG